MYATAPIPRPRALFEAIAESLRERIFSHDLAPGSTLDECVLARELGVSRTPVREALKVLARDGLVTHRNLSGCTVAEFSPTELDALLKVMEHLERFALERDSNPFATETIQRLRDRLYLAAGPDFVETDQAALHQLASQLGHGTPSPAEARGALEDYFTGRRLQVARKVMRAPGGKTAAA